MKTTLTLALIALCCIIYHLIAQPASRQRRQITYNSADIVRLKDGKAIVAVDELTGKEVYVWIDRNGQRRALVDGMTWRTE